MPSYIYYTITDVWGDLTTLSLEFPETTDPEDLTLLVQAFSDLIAPLVCGGLVLAGCQWPVEVSGWTPTPSAGSDVQEKAEFNLTTVTGFRKLISLPTFHESFMLPFKKEVDQTEPAIAALITALESGVDLTSAGGSGVVQPCDIRGDDLAHIAAVLEAWGKRREMVRDLSLYYEIVRSVAWSSLLAYWRFNESSGSTLLDWASGGKNNGAVAGVSWGEPGIGDGSPSGGFDGVNDGVSIPLTYLSSTFNPSQGTVMVWLRSEEPDGANHYAVSLYVDDQNFLRVVQIASGPLRLVYTAGGVISRVDVDSSNIETALTCAVLTWDTTADEVKAYLNGVQTGTTQTDLGTWAGALSYLYLGAGSSGPASVWHGELAHIALWDRALTPAEIAELAEVE